MTGLNLGVLFSDPNIRQEWEKTQQYLQRHSQGVKDGVLTIGDKTLKFRYYMRGAKPANGYSLLFGMHGGGGCAAEVNDGQFDNHLHLYDEILPNGVIWLVPRSCEDVWDMWFQGCLVEFYTIIIRTFVIEQLVDPSKVFLSGYSAGGDGTYNLTPMLADLLAGGAMMGGHPNEVELYNNRNLFFSIQVGGRDGDYDRNQKARDYIQKMKQLESTFGGFSTKYCRIHEECGHWMELQDGAIFNGFLKETRNPYPAFILFKQHSRAQKRYFYYLEVDSSRHKELLIVAKRGNDFHIESEKMPVSIYLNRLSVDYSQEVRVFHNGVLTVCRRPEVNYQVVAHSIHDRMDPFYIFEDCLRSHPSNDRVPLQHSPHQLNPDQFHSPPQPAHFNQHSWGP